MSLRSLQRRLRAEGTTFAREVTIARIRLSQTRMLESGDALARIATDVGFASPAVFSVAFRKHVGVSPSAWRESADKDGESKDE